MVLRRKRRVGTFVAKHHVRVQVGIQILNAIGLHRILERSLALAGGVVGAVSGRVVGSVAVDVHVVVLIVTFEEDGVGNVAAIDGASIEGL